MATAGPALAHKRSRKVLRVLGAFLVLVLATGVALVTWFYYAARSALPQLEGTIQLAGLSAPVTVIRDGHGVPHIAARGLPDLFFAQGFITAQDRLWQMDVTRRYAAGEMAEILGAKLVEHDREQRILGMRQAAERAAASLGPLERACFEAYAGGVNALIESQRNRLPIEFRVLRYRPRPWRVADSMLIGLFMSQLLNHGQHLDEIRREKILAKLGPELTADLYPTRSWRDRPPGSQKRLDTGEKELDEDQPAPVSRARMAPDGSPILEPSVEELLAIGSNNWVISGAHSVTGKPLLSNDMHLPHQIPNTWYEAHLEVRDAAPPQDDGKQDEYELARRYSVAGFTLPGVPFVIVGHNARIAWGFTNLNPDVADVYVETFNDKGEYLTPQGWKKPEIRRERIRVRGGSDVPAGVVVTRHGPIITSLVPGETRQLALKWGAITDPAFTSVPFLEVNAAQNWEEFRRAFSQFGGPGQNVVYADVDGHIGYQATGRIPIRAAGDGSLPVPGHTDAQEWIGVVAFDQFPSAFDQPSGILATANNRITPDGYPHSLATQWFPPYRAERIYRVLESGRKFGAADMLALQMDVNSDFDRFLAEQFAVAVDRAKNPSRRARTAADLMRAWDGQMTVESAAATLAVQSRIKLFGLLLEPRLGADSKLYRWGLQSVALENIVRQRPARLLPEKYANYDELLTAAVEAAVSDADAPRDLGSWRWGKLLALQLQHPLFGSVPVLRRWSGPPGVEQSGGSYTVKQTGRTGGVSERMTVDFADLDASTFNILTGQSGQIFSPHYMDHFSAWQEGSSFALPFTPAAIEKARAHQLILQPIK